MSKTTLMEFPCNFPIKIIGLSSSAFINDICCITKNFFPHFTEKDLKQKSSAKKNYTAITITVYAENQQNLDALYQELTKISGIKMVL